MKIFKYKFTKLIYILILVAMALCVVGFAITVWQVAAYGLEHSVIPTFTILRYVLMFFVTVALFVILLSLVVSSYYSVDGTTFKTSFGFIKSKYDLKKVDAITLDRKSDKLSLTFKDGTFVVIVVKDVWYNDFIQSILDANPAIEYEVKSKTSVDDEDKKK